jgi:hypothetical protein
LGFIANQTTWKTSEKCAKTQFITVWSPLIVTKLGHHFHHNFQTSLRANSHMYMGVNLGCITWVQNMQGYKQRLGNMHKGTEQQGCYLPMIKEEGSN